MSAKGSRPITAWKGRPRELQMHAGHIAHVMFLGVLTGGFAQVFKGRFGVAFGFCEKPEVEVGVK